MIRGVKRHFTSSGKWEIAESFSIHRAEDIIFVHHNNMIKGTYVLKRDYKRQLSRVKEGKESYVVKEFRRPGPWWIFRPDAISWKNAYKMRDLGMPVAKVYAWLKSKDGRGFIIMEDLGDLVLSHILKDLTPDSSERRFFIEQIAQLVARLHRKNVVYGDLKLTNVMIRDSSLFLVDWDKIKQKKRLRLTDRLFNLKQIIGSFPSNLTDDEFNLFCNTYIKTKALSFYRLLPKQESL